jgi:hypothetical protein
MTRMKHEHVVKLNFSAILVQKTGFRSPVIGLMPSRSAWRVLAKLFFLMTNEWSDSSTSGPVLLSKI